LAKEDSNFHVVDISDGTLGKDQLHFDANGAETLGKRMYEVIKKL
jgi:lysophospholipase L1-like esterase